MNIDTYLSDLATLVNDYTAEQKRTIIMSKSILDKPKSRVIDSFTLDYMYEEEE